ncbi:hypothetical protein [Aquimarina algiphila]|uniref:Uncharacterized protein n=1 Tax=Aquimarina algiphila TaxID=2047982 RepID=A0A554VRN4_9FLAO|nr:hypothetical protein [Aquimarina algiphila]TSE11317.1 hypothetical protein FOF46_01420 [Aquimarina algiphila]
MKNKPPTNSLAEFAVKTLKEYAHQNQLPPRSTSDLSPLEKWLIEKLLYRDIIIKDLLYDTKDKTK